MTTNSFRLYGVHVSSDTSLEEGWAISQSCKMIRDEFEKQTLIYKWDEKFEFTPFWAYWFARNIIVDYWPAAERFIKQNTIANSLYDDFVETCIFLNILNYSVEGSQDFYLSEAGNIISWREGKKPIKIRNESFEEVADRIEENVTAFQRQKKLKLKFHEDIDNAS